MGLVQPAPEFGSQPGGATLPFGATMVSKRTPAVAVVSLDTTVLLMKLTFSASCIDTPPPAQPATLFAMMLLVTVIAYQLFGFSGLRCTSLPFTYCRRSPPPLPLWAVFPTNRFASILLPGPTPSLKPGAQSTSVTEPHSVGGLPVMPSGAEPCTMSPPPQVGRVGLVLWLNRNALCA